MTVVVLPSDWTEDQRDKYTAITNALNQYRPRAGMSDDKQWHSWVGHVAWQLASRDAETADLHDYIGANGALLFSLPTARAVQ